MAHQTCARDVSHNPVFVAHVLLDREAHGSLSGRQDRKRAEGDPSRRRRHRRALHAGGRPRSALPRPPRSDRPPPVTLGMRQGRAAGVEVIEAESPDDDGEVTQDLGRSRAHPRDDGTGWSALAEFFAWVRGCTGQELITELTIDRRSRAPAPAGGFRLPQLHDDRRIQRQRAQPHYKATEDRTPRSHTRFDWQRPAADRFRRPVSRRHHRHHARRAVGETTAAQRRDYTLVLKGMIALSVARFPRGTKSPIARTLARAPIWAAGIDFGHGTRHGVGYFLNVHEGPHGITPHLARGAQTRWNPA